MSIADASQRAHPPSALPRGTRLGEFELRHVLGVGGFGIVYLAFDHALEREVAVKEYLPATLVGRTETMHVTLRSQSDADTFALGLKSFVNEARLLAHFDHPSLLKVLRFWEANGTAYMAMPVLRGHTVKEVRLDMTQPPDEAWMRALLDPLLGAIERLHAEGVFHRDIAPDNIQIEPDGRPVLLDFGAARRVISDKTQSLTAILKPAYAPIEQYAEAGSVKQGPWTDLYALGATLYYVLLARPPLPATARAVHDDLPPLSAQAVPGCSAEFLNIIDWMLAPRPLDRPQSVAALRDVLAGRAPAPRRKVEPVASGSWERSVNHAAAGAASAPAPEETYAATMVMPARDSSALAPKSAVSNLSTVPLAPSAPSAPVRAAAAPRSRALPVLMGLAVVAVLGAAVAFGLRPGGAVSPQSAASAPDLATLAASAPAVATAFAPTAAGAVAPSPSPPSPMASAPAAPTLQAAAPSPSLPPAQKQSASTRLPVPAPAPGPSPAPVLQAAPASPPVQSESSSPTRPQVAEAAPVAVPAAPAAPAPKPLVAGPEATCAGRNPLAFFVCMERECLRSEFGANQHADCRKWRANRPADSPTY